MHSKRIFTAFSVVIALAMLLTACGTAATPTASGSTGGNTIAGVVFQDDQFMNSMVQGFKDAGAKYGVTILTANTNNDQSKEAELIQTYIAQGVNGIAIAPLSKDASIANLKEAAGKGIKIAITNMSISDPSFLTGGFTSDDRSNGKIVGDNAAKFIQDKLSGKAKVAIVDFDDQLPDQSKARYGGFEDGLKGAGVTYDVVAHQSAHLQDDALAKVTDMLTAHPETQVIFACNEGGTIGAAMAVKQAGLAGKVAVFGYDGSDQLTSMVLSGDNILLGTVAQDPYTQGYKAVEALAKTLKGETVADAGKMTIVPGTYLGVTDLAAVNAWRKANGLAEVTAPAAKKLAIAGVVFQDDQFMNSMVQGFKDAGAKYGVDVLTANTNNDQSKEAELIQTYMAQGVNGIAIAPLSKDASIANLKEAAGKGIKIAITNMSISDPSFLTGGFTSDDRSNGKIVGDNAAKFIQDKLGGTAKVAIVDFDDQLPDQSKARYGGFEDGLKAAGIKYDVVAHQSAHLQDDALAKVTDMLTAHPETQVIFASNEGGTIGAAMAVKQAGLAGKVAVFGYDGSDQLTSMVLSGDNILLGTVAQDPYTQGYMAVEALAKTLNGETVADAGKMTIVPGTYLGVSDLDAVKAWREANGLP